MLVKSDTHPGVAEKKVLYAGRTLDLTLFAVCRAVDVLIGEVWSQRRARREAAHKWTKVRLFSFPVLFDNWC